MLAVVFQIISDPESSNYFQAVIKPIDFKTHFFSFALGFLNDLFMILQQECVCQLSIHWIPLACFGDVM